MFEALKNWKLLAGPPPLWEYEVVAAKVPSLVGF
jgi:hypothetical protein